MKGCKLLLNGKEVGQVRWEEAKTGATLWASCPFEEGYIYRVSVKGEGGLSLPVGVMMPEGERFTLKKKLALGISQPLMREPEHTFTGVIARNRPGEVNTPPLPFSFSELKEYGEENLKTGDRLLQYCMQKSRVKYGAHEGVRYIVFPLDIGGECNMAPFLTITTVMEYEGAFYGVLCMDQAGVISPLATP